MQVMIYGASKGGEVAKALLEESGHEVMGFIDDFKGGCVSLSDYNGPYPIVSEMFNNEVRTRIPLQKYATFIHPSAYVCKTAAILPGVFIKPRASIGHNVRIGVGCVIDSCVNIEHDTVLDSGVFVAPSSVIGSSVHIGELSLIGIGCVIQSGVRIGKSCTVVSGTTVFSDIPDGTIYKGFKR